MYINRDDVIGVRARDRSEIHCREAKVKSPISSIPDENRPRLLNYNTVLLMSDGRRIVGPAIIDVNVSKKIITFTHETWILLGPFHCIGFLLLTPERRLVCKGDLDFCIPEGGQDQLTLLTNWAKTVAAPLTSR